MKCKDCPVFGCQYRTIDAEKDYYYEQWTAKKKSFDLQSFRAQAAKDILCAMISHFGTKDIDMDDVVNWTDSLIAKLKEKEEK